VKPILHRVPKSRTLSMMKYNPARTGSRLHFSVTQLNADRREPDLDPISFRRRDEIT
jgi:hypothetical protein